MVPVEADPHVHRTFAYLRSQILEPDEVGGAVVRADKFQDLRFLDEESALLAFIQQYGFLGSDEWGDEGRDGRFETIDYLRQQQRRLSTMLDFGKDSPGASREKIFNRNAPVVAVKLAKSRRNEFEVRIAPRTLLGWMWLGVAHDFSTGVRYDGPPCLWCRQPMPRGGADGHRIDARTCSDRCRTYFNRLPEDERTKRLRAAGWLKRQGSKK